MLRDASIDIRQKVLGSLPDALGDSLSDNFTEAVQAQLKTGKKFKGKVVDNNDPDKMGRCRIMVFGVYEDIPQEHIPWANPEQTFVGSTMGNFIVPPIGALVNVTFENEEIYNPVYSTKVVNSGSMNFSAGIAEDYPDTMCLFETDKGDFFTINRRTGKTIYRHSTGLMAVGDEKGNLLLSTKASGGSIIIESGAALNIYSNATTNVISDDHIYLQGKVICLKSDSMVYIKSDLVVDGNIKVEHGGRIDDSHIHIGNNGYATSTTITPPNKPVIIRPYTGGGSSGAGSSVSPETEQANVDNPQLEEVSTAEIPVEAEIPENITLEEVLTWKEKFKVCSENWLIGKHFWEIASLSSEELAGLPTQYLAFSNAYREFRDRYQVYYLKEMEEVTNYGGKLYKIITEMQNGERKNIISAGQSIPVTQQIIEQVSEKIPIEISEEKTIYHFSSVIPTDIVVGKIPNYRAGSLKVLEQKETVVSNGEFYAPNIIAATTYKGIVDLTGIDTSTEWGQKEVELRTKSVSMKMNQSNYRQLNFIDVLGQEWKYEEERNVLWLKNSSGKFIDPTGRII